MVKTRTSKKQEASLEELSNLDLENIPDISREYPLEYLTEERIIGLAILECLQNNDPEGVMEVIGIYLNALNKAHLRKKAHLSKSTMYHTLKSKNPTIKTLAKIVSACTH